MISSITTKLKGFIFKMAATVAIVGLGWGSAVGQAPFVQNTSADGLGQYGYLEKDATTFMRLNSNTYGNIYQLFGRTFLNGNNILTYGTAVNSCGGSGVVQSTNNYNFGANAIAGQIAYTSVHADYCGGGNSYSSNPNNTGFNERQHYLFDISDRPADVQSTIFQMNSGAVNVVMSVKIDFASVSDRVLQRFWIKNTGTLAEASEIANDGFKIYYEPATGSETFNGTESNAILYGDYAGDATNNNFYGHNALGISVPSGGLRVYVVLNKFNACITTAKTAIVSLLNDGLNFTPKMDVNFDYARVNQVPASPATCTVSAINTAAALSGTYYIPSTCFPTIASAITALNTSGVTGATTINVAAGYTETAPAGGFVLTATGTSTNTITFRKLGSGANPTITANGTLTSGNTNDAIWKIVGGDYITIDGFTLNEHAAAGTIAINTNTKTEFGIAIYNAAAGNGAQNITIRNNTIDMGTAGYTQSMGIMSTCTFSSAGTSGGTAPTAQAATSSAGTNINLAIYGNTISNVRIGITVVTPAQTATINQTGLDIGGTSVATANTITNSISAALTTAYTNLSTTSIGAITLRNVAGVSVQYNSITSTTSGTVSQSGIVFSAGTSPAGFSYTKTVSNNTIGITSTATGAASITGIDLGYGLNGATFNATLVCSSNTVTLNQNTAATAATGIYYGIYATYPCISGTLNSNNVTLNQTHSASATINNSSGLYGLYLPSGTTSSPTVTALNNTILINRTLDASGAFTGTLSGPLQGIAATVAVSNLNIGSAGNPNAVTIKEAIGGGTGTKTYSSTVTFITLGNVGHGTVNVVNNTLNTTASTIRSTRALSVIAIGTTTITSLVNVKSNTSNIDRIATGANAISFFNQSSGSPSTPADTISSNNITFTNLAGSGAVTIIQEACGPGSPTILNKSICNNTINVGGTNSGTQIGISFGYATGVNIRGNSITFSTASTSITGIVSTTGVTTTNAHTMSGNTISLTSSTTSATSMIGLNIGVGGNFNVFSNTISALNFLGLSTGGAPVITGINVNTGSNNIYQNLITGLNQAGTLCNPLLKGISVTSTGTNNIYRNTVAGLSTSNSGTGGTLVSGIHIAATTGIVNIYNNIVGRLTMPNATNGTANPLGGIYISSASTTTNNNIFNNTVYLSGGAGATFYSGALVSGTSTLLDVRNNIFINECTPSATGFVAGYFRTGAISATYVNNSNNNLWFAGTPSATRLLYCDASSALNNQQTLTALKTYFSTREGASITGEGTFTYANANSFFINTATVNTTDFLHVKNGITTQVESGATAVSSPFSISNDYDGQVRPGGGGTTNGGGTSPDIGADEFDGIPADLTPPTISSVTATNPTCISTNPTVTAVITDGSLIGNTVGTSPRIYFKKSTTANVLASDNTNAAVTDGWKFMESTTGSSPYSFTIDYSLLNAAPASGDIIQYIIVAEDRYATPNVGINGGTFNATQASSALTSTAFPIGSITNTFTLPTVVNGTVSVGAGQTYTTLTGAGGLFEAINVNGQGSNVTANIVSAAITEPGTFALNQATSPCGGGPFTLLIKPTGGISAVLSGSVAGPLISLNGADNVTFDGLNASSNSLTIDNTSTNIAASTIKYIGDASNNTITNCTIKGASTATTTGTIWYSTGTTTGNIGNALTNNTITASGANSPVQAIYSLGSSNVIPNTVNVTGNNISDYFSATLVSAGINLSSPTGNMNWTISDNRLFQSANRIYTANNTHWGINIAGGAGYTITGNTIGYANSSGTGSMNLIGLGSGAFTGTFPTGYTVGTGVASGARFIGINCAFTAAGTNSIIQSNTIGGIAIFTSSNASTVAGAFCGINLQSGNATIGGATAGLGNTIGSTSSTGSIYLASTVTGSTAVGIYATSANTVSIQNNTIGGIDASGTAASISGGITGIDVAGAGLFTIADNSVGSGVAANMRTGYFFDTALLGVGRTATSTSGATAAFVGIRSAATGATLSMTGNILRGWRVTGTTTAVTGITSTGANTSSVTINGNYLGYPGRGWLNYSFANSGALTGISLTGATAATTHSIQNNDFVGISHTAQGSNAHTYITLTGATAANDVATISGNTFTALAVNTTGGITFINHNYNIATTGSLTLNNNSIATSFANSGAGAFTITTTNGASNAGSVNNYTNNNFSNITLTGASTVLGFNNTDGGTGSTKTITGNVFDNWSGTTNAITCMNFTYWNGVSSLSTNQITNIAGQRAITAINLGNAANAATSIAINNNVINNLVSSGTGGVVTGIVSNNTSTAINITGNTINTLSSTNASSAINAIQISGGTTVNIAKNKIYDLSSNGTTPLISGLSISAGTTFNISNNVIGDLRAPNGSNGTTDVIRGINFSAAVASTSYNVYYNTIYLAASGGANFTTSGIFHTTSATATTSKLELRNNIIVNNSTPSGTGLTIAYRRSSGAANALANFGATSNNNLFFAGTPGATRLIYSDGTSTAQTLAAYKGGVFTAGTIATGGRETASVTENPPFANTATGANANYLHFVVAPAGTGTQAESGAAVIAGFTDDYATAAIRTGYPLGGQAGGGGTAPDIGADEGDFLIADLTPPVITLTSVPSAGCSTPTFTATITDASGIDVTPGTRPRVYYKISTTADVLASDNTSSAVTDGWKFAESTTGSSPFTFNIDLSILNTALVNGNTLQYFVVAEDNAATPNVGISGTTTFANPQSTAALASNAFAIVGTPTSITATVALSGTVTVGTAGTYATFNGASGLFSALNTAGLSGNLIVNVISNVTETAQTPLNAISSCAGGPYTVTIQSDGTTQRVISPSTASISTAALIELNGADNITIDGSFGTLTGQYLSFRNTNGSGGAVFLLDNDASNITINNCDIQGYSSTTTSGVVSLGAGTTTGNTNITVDKCNIHSSQSGYPLQLIYSNGNNSARNNNITISNCNLYDFSSFGGGSGARRAYAINVTSTGNGSNWNISGNSIYNTFIDGTGPQTGISFLPGSASSSNVIQSNYIGGSSPLCGSGGATPYWSNNWYVSNTINQLDVVTINSGTILVDGNTIKRIRNTNSDYSGIQVITIAGSTTATVSNNVIGNSNAVQAEQIIASGGGISFGSYGGWIFGIYNTGSGALTATGNSISYLAQTGAYMGGWVFGIYQVGNGAFTATNNTIKGLICDGFTSDSYSLGVSGSNISGIDISNNDIEIPFTLGNGYSSVGIMVNGTSNSGVISKNRISGGSYGSNLSSTYFVDGIYLGGSGTWNVKNNMISLGNYDNAGVNSVLGQTWSFANYNVWIDGIDDNLTGASSNLSCSYNSVNIGGTQTGATGNFSYAFRRRPSTVDVPTLRNNIFVNGRSGGTSSSHIALGTNSTTNWSGSSSNYNFLASLDLNTLGNYNGTLKTFSTWQTTTSPSQDLNSTNAQVTTGSSSSTLINSSELFTSVADADLHMNMLNSNAYSFVSNYGTPVAETTDFDGVTRDATNPDIGADEFTVPPLDAGVTAFASTSFCPGSGSVQAVVTNFGTTTLTSFDVTWSVNGSSQGTVNITGQSIAQGATATVTLGNFTFIAATNYTITAATSNPNSGVDGNAGNNSFTSASFQPALSGTYTVGSGQNFATLTAAVAAANANGLCGATIFSLTDASYSGSETFPITINALAGASATNTLTIRPTGNTTISGSSASGVIVLNGADYVTIDGSSAATTNTICPASVATRNLTISNTNTATTSAVVWISNSATDGATNNAVLDCNLNGNSNSTTFCVIGTGGASVGSYGKDNDNNSFINNNLTKAQYGIFCNGESASNKDQGTVINQNLINSASPNNILIGGVYVGFENNISISGNTISEINTSAYANDAFGIVTGLADIAHNSFVSDEVTNANINNNIIGTVIHTVSAYSCVGIGTSSATSGTTTIANNIISGVLSNGTGTDMGAGILVGGGAGSITNVFYNTVSMSGTTTGANRPTYGLAIGGSNPVVYAKNNIFTVTASTGANKNRAIGTAYATLSNLTSDNNDLFVSGTSAAIAQVSTGTNLNAGTAYTTLANWQTISSDDASSKNVAPVFISGTDLHLNTSNASNTTNLNATGAVVSITSDIDCETRNASTPDIGADEYTPPACLPPTALTTTNILLAGVDIGWTAPSPAPSNGYIWKIVAAGAGSGGTAIVTSPVAGTTAGTSITGITGLTASTSYDLWVQADCGGTQSPWAGPANFTTTSPEVLGTVVVNQASTASVLVSDVNREILRIDLPVTGTAGTLTLNGLTVNAANISDADIAALGVRLYYTTTTTFATTTPVGSGISLSGGVATFTGLTQALATGNNYIWVSYNIASTATIWNTVDATIPAGGITIAAAGGATATGSIPVSLGNPAGNRKIDYCPISGTINTARYISNITTTGGISNINNTSTYNANAYQDFSSIVVNQNAGSSINLSATIVGVSGGVDFGIYVDWNHNGLFTDAGEEMYTTGAQISTNPSNISIPIPANAYVGTTGMRIWMNYTTSTPAPCAVPANGEVEDYTFSINPAPAPNCVTTYSPVTGSTVALNSAISWTAPSGAPTGYDVYFDQNNPPTTLVSNNQAGTSYTPSGMTGGQTYYLMAIARNASGPATSCTPATFVTAANMAYTSGNTIQLNNGTVFAPSSANNQIIQVQVVTTGTNNPFNVTSLVFATTGSTSPSTDFTNAKVYYTGTTNTFATTTQFGTTSVSPNGTFTVSGTQALAAGTNYFWLTYDIGATPTVLDDVDACCTSIVMNGAGGTQTPSTTCPAGNATINVTYCSNLYTTGCSANDYINNISISNLSQTATGCTGGMGYEDYTGTTVNFSQGVTYPFTITSGSSLGENIGWWIDFNDNGSFGDAGEFLGNTYVASATITGNVSVPLTATTGNHRMRVRMVYNSGNTQALGTSCTSYPWGETHDYTVNIGTSPSCATPTYAAYPFSENFEFWISCLYTNEEPGVNWSASPLFGDNSWRRNDQGTSASWTSTSGAYSPTSTLGSFSARFHSFNANGTQGNIDLFINCSSGPAIKELTFDYNNTSGTDVLAVFMSTTGPGGTFTQIGTTLGIRSSSAWTKQYINFTSTSATTVIRFRATGDNGSTDIGVDNLTIGDPCTVAYATYPFTESFESWINCTGTSNVPGVNWTTSQIPSFGDNCWRRNDQGTTAVWTSTSGAYSPVSTLGSTSARFHSFNANGTQGNIDLYIDCSSGPSTKELTFDYNNTSGTDVLAILVSTNGPAGPFTQLGSNLGIRSSSAWTKQYINFTSSSATTVIRFRATGDNGSTDIGVDNLTIGAPCSPSYASYPFSESFETWINCTGTSNVPGVNWTTSQIPSFGDNCWRRNDQGTTAVWTSTSGAYSPVFTVGASSARFHSFNANGTQGNIDLYIDCSSGPSLKEVAFDYINTDGTDVLAVLVSTTGPSGPFTQVGSNVGTATATSWTRQYINFTSTSATTVIRLRATGDNGSTDIGVDNLTIGAACTPTYATLPYAGESFESWTNCTGNSNVPSNNWTSSPIPSFGNNVWRRNDEGVTRGYWSNLTGAYSPLFSVGTKSARFHSYNANGTTGILDFYIDLSSSTASKNITFDYINTSGTDVLGVYVSTNGAAGPFTQLGSNLGVIGTWTNQSFTTSSNSATTVIRLQATGDNGFTDIGLDNFQVVAQAPLAITSITGVQQTGNVSQNSNNNNMLRVDIAAAGTAGTLTLNTLKVTGTNTNNADITGITLWTGTVSAPTAQIGTTTFSGGVATFSGLSTGITLGTTYLWVRYNVSASATPGNLTDGKIVIGDITIIAAGGATAPGSQPVADVDPVGNRPIVGALCGTTYTINNLSATAGLNYNSFTDAVNDLNLRGVSCAVVFNVKDGQTFNELVPAITATGTVTNTITFQRDNSTGTRPSLVGTTGVGTLDAVLQLNGSDYITWDGINLSDNAANATATTRMEYGVYMQGAATNGCKNNTIRNANISLTRTYSSTRCVWVSSAASSSAGSNSDNKFFNIAASNSTWGYNFDGNASFPDSNNEINTSGGGTSSINAMGVNTNSATYGVIISNEQGFKLYNTSMTDYTATSGGDIFVFNASAGSANTMDIQNNTISGITLTGSTSARVRGVSITSGTSATVSNNIIRDITTQGYLFGIYSNQGSLTASANTIGSAGNPLTCTGVVTQLVGIFASGGSSIPTITNNIISNLVVSSGSSTYFEGIDVNTPNATITGNTIQNCSTNGTSTSLSSSGIYFGTSASSNINCSNNTISGLSASSSGYMIAIESDGAGVTINNNNISTISNTGSGWIWAISFNGLSTVASNNTVSGLTTNSGSCSGIVAAGSSATIRANTIRNLSAGSGSSMVAGAIAVFGSGTNTIEKNIVDNIDNTGTTGAMSLGIRASGTSTSTNIVNNMISRITANNSNNGVACAVRGITLESGTTAKVYNNTVYLTGTATNAAFESGALYTTTSATLDSRNNILYNGYGGTGKKAAIYFTSSDATYQTNLNAASNNNLLFAGTPGANNVMLRVNTGGDKQTLANYTTLTTGKEGNSFTPTVAIPFVNTSSSPYDLHIDATSATLCEFHNKGVAITSPLAVTDDIDAGARGSVPDVGADEWTMPTPTAASVAAPAALCGTNSVTLTGTGASTGTEIFNQWQVSATGSGGSFSNITNGGVYSGATTAALTISSVSGLNGYAYRLVTSRCSPTAATSANSNAVTLSVTAACSIVWTGAVSTNWNTTGNWSSNVVPTATDDAIIPNVANDPIVGAYTATCKNINMASGATLGFAGPIATSELVINGTTITMANNTVSGAGTFQVGGASPVVATVTGGAIFNNDVVRIGAGSSLELSGSTDYQVAKAIRVEAGSFVYSFGSNGATAYLRLKDDGINTGLIDYTASATGHILGSIIAERKVSGGQGYRYLSSPVQNSLSQWADDFTITGANGFASGGTAYTNPWPTVWTYNETNTNADMRYGWVSSTSPSTVFDRATGYACIMGAPQIDVTGPVWVNQGNAGTMTKAISYTSSGTSLSDGWNLIGNPFAAPLDFTSFYSDASASTINSSKMVATSYSFRASSQYQGTYATYNALSAAATNGGVRNIASHQGFFIKGTSAGNLTLKSTYTSSNPAYTFLKQTEEIDYPRVRLSIMQENELVDECLAMIHPNATLAKDDGYDSEKLFAQSDNVPEIYLADLGIQDSKLAISAHPKFEQATVIPIGLSTAGVFEVSVNELENMPSDISVYLEDTKAKSFVKLNQFDKLTLSKSDNERNEGRYYLRFGKFDEAISATDAQRIGYTYLEQGTISVRLFGLGSTSTVEVMDIAGKHIATAALSNGNGINSLNGLGLAPGVYVVKVSTDKGTFTDRVVVE